MCRILLATKDQPSKSFLAIVGEDHEVTHVSPDVESFRATMKNGRRQFNVIAFDPADVINGSETDQGALEEFLLAVDEHVNKGVEVVVSGNGCVMARMQKNLGVIPEFWPSETGRVGFASKIHQVAG